MIHLHNHSIFSFLDGIVKIDDYINKTKELGLEYLALTDHGNLCGIFELYKKCLKNNITPIIGSEFYYVNDKANKERSKDHMIVIAKTQEGLKNLFELSSDSYRYGFYYTPTIDYRDLYKHRNGLIIMTACIGGNIPKMILDNKIKKDDIYQQVERFQNDFDDFYFEIQLHNTKRSDKSGVNKQIKVNQELINLSKKFSVPLVLTNDVHYLNKEDCKIHDLVYMIRTKKTFRNFEWNGFDDLYFKTKEDVINDYKSLIDQYDNFSKDDFKQAIKNTHRIAKMVKKGNIKIDRSLKLPKVNDDSKDNKKMFKSIIFNNFQNKLDNNIIDVKEKEKYQDRIDHELKVIFSKGFQDYFMVIYDIVKHCADNDYYVNIGRGSVVGSLVAYLLGITKLDPMKYGLKFERFITKKRSKLEMVLNLQ